jgi:hypothetical protein
MFKCSYRSYYTYKKRGIKTYNGWSQTGAKYSIATTTFIDNQLVLNAPALGLSYSGKYENEIIKVF